ncbi:MAG: hypothetical protein KKE16_00115 [Firmicutes bacterium]|nr:hypothetical protein [Bacillota bacterium]
MSEFDESVQDLFEKGPVLKSLESNSLQVLKEFAGSWKALIIPLSYTAVAVLSYFIMRTLLAEIYAMSGPMFSPVGGVEAYVNRVSMTSLILQLVFTSPLWLIYFGAKSESNMSLTGVQIFRVLAQIYRVILYIGVVVVVISMFALLMVSPVAAIVAILIYGGFFSAVLIFINRFIDFLQDTESVLKGQTQGIPDASKLRIFLVLICIFSVLGVLMFISASQILTAQPFELEGVEFNFSKELLNGYIYLSLPGVAISGYWLYLHSEYQKLK